MVKKKRNYRKEYDNYQSKGDGKDVHHRDGNPKNRSSKNLSVKSKARNRSFKRTKTAGKRRR